MEFWIAFGVTFIIGSIYSYGKKHTQKEQSNNKTANNPKSTAEQQRKFKQADEELITVILPTINHDK